MSPIEIVAVISGLLCVWFVVKENVWNWPIGLVQVILYIWIFGHAKLYSDMILQIIYVPIQFYGWWAWLHGGPASAKLPIMPIDNRKLYFLIAGKFIRVKRLHLWMALTLVLTLVWGRLMMKIGAAAPYADGFVAIASLVASYLMARKYIESWVFWISVDVIAIGVYIYKHLYLTSGLYAVFLGLAITGLWTWQKSFHDRAAGLRKIEETLYPNLARPDEPDRVIRVGIPTQWWVNDCCSGGKNWCKTSWRYVLTGKHRGQQIRLDLP